MNELILTYIKMIRSGFFNESLIGLIILILLSVINVKGTMFNYIRMSFFIICGSIIINIILSAVSGNRYVFISALPVKIKDVIKIIYFHTYIIYIIAFIATSIAEIIINKKLSISYLIEMDVFIILANIFYSNFSTLELKSGVDFEEKMSIDISLIIIGAIILSSISLIWNKVNLNISNNTEFLILTITTILTVSTIKVSYKATLKNIMGS